jgi:hypothetical protein
MRLIAIAMFAGLGFLATAASAAASATEYKISFTGFCNFGTVKLNPYRAAYREEVAQGSCEDVIGEGFQADTTVSGRQGRWLVIGQLNSTYPKEEQMNVLERPLVTGGRFFFYTTTDGEHMWLISSGTYAVSGAAPAIGAPPLSGLGVAKAQ